MCLLNHLVFSASVTVFTLHGELASVTVFTLHAAGPNDPVPAEHQRSEREMKPFLVRLSTSACATTAIARSKVRPLKYVLAFPAWHRRRVRRLPASRGHAEPGTASSDERAKTNHRPCPRTRGRPPAWAVAGPAGSGKDLRLGKSPDIRRHARGDRDAPTKHERAADDPSGAQVGIALLP